MTKADLIKKIATAANINATEAKQALDAATESIKQALAAGEKVQLLGFGTFSVNERPAREGKNPQARPYTSTQRRLPSSRLALTLKSCSTRKLGNNQQKI